MVTLLLLVSLPTSRQEWYIGVSKEDCTQAQIAALPGGGGSCHLKQLEADIEEGWSR